MSEAATQLAEALWRMCSGLDGAYRLAEYPLRRGPIIVVLRHSRVTVWVAIREARDEQLMGQLLWERGFQFRGSQRAGSAVVDLANGRDDQELAIRLDGALDFLRCSGETIRLTRFHWVEYARSSPPLAERGNSWWRD